VFENTSLTYAQLNIRANQVAHHLVKLGVGPENIVALALPRSVEMVVALLAILKAGAAYLPLDLDYPAERLKYMLQDAQPIYLITILEMLQHLVHVTQNVSLLCLDDTGIANTLAGVSKANPTDQDRPRPFTPHSPAYVIYTSGSTGTPKGVVMSEGAIVNRLGWMQADYELNASDRVLQKTPVSFDVSVWEFFWPLIEGAGLVLAKSAGHKDPAYLADLIQTRGITTFHFVPSMLQSFLQNTVLASRCELRRVFCSGETLSSELQERFYAILDVPLHNQYGPTETGEVTSWKCHSKTELALIPLGRPIWNTQVYVLDGRLQPVPVGRGRGIVHRRQRAGARLSQPSRSNSRTLHC